MTPLATFLENLVGVDSFFGLTKTQNPAQQDERFKDFVVPSFNDFVEGGKKRMLLCQFGP